jgi:hypothetical protein
MKTKIAASLLVLAAVAGPAAAAAPTYGTPQGELACAGLLDLAFRSSSTAAKPDPKTVTVTAMAFSFFVGRVNQAQPRATPAEIKAAAAKLTPDERNAYGNLCLKKAGEVMSPLLR